MGKIILIKPDLSYANEILKDFNGQALHWEHLHPVGSVQNHLILAVNILRGYCIF